MFLNPLAKKFVPQESFTSLSDLPEAPWRLRSKIESQIATSLLDSFDRLLNVHPNGRGVWHQADYEEYCHMTDFPPPRGIESGYADPEYFELIAPYTFQIQADKSPSLALHQFFYGPTIADSASAISACFYKCLYDILGQEAFDTLFINAMVISTDIFSADSPLSLLQEERSDLHPPKFGEVCHISECSPCPKKHPKKINTPWVVLYVGEGKYDGHGLIAPITMSQMQVKLSQCYHKGVIHKNNLYKRAVTPGLDAAKIAKLYDNASNLATSSRFSWR